MTPCDQVELPVVGITKHKADIVTLQPGLHIQGSSVLYLSVCLGTCEMRIEKLKQGPYP